MQNNKKNGKGLHPSLKSVNFVLPMSKQLTSEQRYAIYLGLARKQFRNAIAAEIGVHPSTITREVKRNCNREGKYVFTIAQEKCDSRKHSTLGNHRKDDILWWRVEQMIKDEDWSPRQISGVLCKEGLHICPQTIYNHVHADKTGELKKHMPHQLRYQRKEKKAHVTKATNIPNRISIHERPAEADGKRFGDWEMDLIVDAEQRAILTLVERSTNMLLMERMKHGKKAVPIAKAVVRLLMPYRQSVRTVTTDNGSEFAAHQMITKGLHVKGKEDVVVYFTDAYSSWQKGCIENTNKLIRKYIPKHTMFNRFSDAYIMNVQKKLNRRPREKLNFDTPKDCFFKHFI
jgi:IS30 family transposase